MKIPLKDFIQAYYDCRKHKRNKINSLEFEINWEKNIIKLWRDVNTGYYSIGKSICFLVRRPKLREVFAADFRDRIVHHIIMQRLEPLFEDFFIDDTYNCRKGKGVLYGVKRLQQQITEAKLIFQGDCYIQKFDMSGFFMSIDKQLLLKMLLKFINSRYKGEDKEILINLVTLVVMNEPQKNCIFKTPRSEWKNLDSNKSLFGTNSYGLPIGNLTSQWFANFYLSLFDLHMFYKYIFYGRYVDDFYVITPNSKSVFKDCQNYLKKFHIILHPRKIYIQHFTKGVKFTGYVIKYNRIYIGNQIIKNIYNLIITYNNKQPTIPLCLKYIKSLNSYWGFLKQGMSYNLKIKLIKRILLNYFNYISYKSKFSPKYVTKKILC